MARVGVLSDLAVKQRNPEFFPLDVGGQELMHPIHLQKNIFKGIKPPKRIKRFTDVSRFPINDLKNFAQFGSAGRDKEAQFYAIMNYRKELGSNNVMPHLETAFQARNKADYTRVKKLFKCKNESNISKYIRTRRLPYINELFSAWWITK
jgi:hypothetical protein